MIELGRADLLGSIALGTAAYHLRMRSYCLSFHAGYRCRHSGACCAARWPIPMEAGGIAGLRTRGMLNRPGLLTRRHRGDGGRQWIAGRTATGACVFFDGDARLCSIQRHAGPELMPSACRNFPRVALKDSRGIFITLSHYCPGAARLLLDAGDIAVVDAPASVSLDGEVEGLDATAVLPPLLRPGMLMDFEGYAAWEQEALAVLNERMYSARTAISVVAAATADACRWTPGQEPLATWVRSAFGRARSAVIPGAPCGLTSSSRPVKAFLAAHLFASWSAYQQGGLGAIVESVRLALTLLETELPAVTSPDAFISAVRATDLRLRHSHVTPHS
jgi:Fe-S-cluster containining protein